MEHPIDCNKGPDIEAVKKEQRSIKQEQNAQGHKIDKVLENQLTLSADLKAAIDRLTVIIEQNIGTRMEVEQLKKDRETLFDMRRTDALRLEQIEIRNARCDGAGIFESWPSVLKTVNNVAVMMKDFDEVHEEYLQHKGVRRFVPAIMTVLSFCILVYVTFFQGEIKSNGHAHLEKDPRGAVSQDYGVPK